MARDNNDTKTLDIDPLNQVDRAVRAIRDYQKGQATAGFMRATLANVKAEDLGLVALGTRLSLAELQRLYSPG